MVTLLNFFKIKTTIKNITNKTFKQMAKILIPKKALANFALLFETIKI